MAEGIWEEYVLFFEDLAAARPDCLIILYDDEQWGCDYDNPIRRELTEPTEADPVTDQGYETLRDLPSDLGKAQIDQENEDAVEEDIEALACIEQKNTVIPWARLPSVGNG